ncbi:Uncharacterised protein [Mycobacteroides abscessus subsp. massiliense]|uniref:Uncharacterized protein n=1 Tax=Mycobacteroides abscessus subsp. massiliense TaxID=1962118 RepID=A0A1T8VCZ9_9MYCO|nr:Uncharacterised protein [Mycobacteroides abscessus subsp. massiliense]
MSRGQSFALRTSTVLFLVAVYSRHQSASAALNIAGDGAAVTVMGAGADSSVLTRPAVKPPTSAAVMDTMTAAPMPTRLGHGLGGGVGLAVPDRGYPAVGGMAGGGVPSRTYG